MVRRPALLLTAALCLVVVLISWPAAMAATSQRVDESHDYVDQISNLHTPTDIGSHSSFAEEQDYDGVYDTLTEADAGGQTQVAFTAAGTGAATITTSVTPGYPASPQSGDLFLGTVMILDTTTSPSSFTGFTSLLEPYTSGTDGRVWVYYRYSDGSETGTTTVSRASGTTGFFARIYGFRYAHQTIGSAYEAVNWVSEGSVSTVLDRGVTTSGTMELALNFVFVGEDTNTYVSFTGETGGDWTEVVAQFSNGAGNDGTLQLQCATMATAGTVDGGSFAMGAADPTGVLGLALIPATVTNYRLDLEVGWTSADYDESVEYLCLYGGTQDAEALQVDLWTGSWTTIVNDVQPGWNNVSIASYLTDATVEVRFVDATQSSDASQGTWQVEALLLHVYSTEYAEARFEALTLAATCTAQKLGEAMERAFYEVFTLASSLTVVVQSARTLFDTLTLVATALTVKSGLSTRQLYEMLTLAGTLTTTLTLTRTFTDTLTLAENLVTVKSGLFTLTLYEWLQFLWNLPLSSDPPGGGGGGGGGDTTITPPPVFGLPLNLVFAIFFVIMAFRLITLRRRR
jgi:hypothetical protein